MEDEVDDNVKISGLAELAQALPDNRWHRLVIYLRKATDGSAIVDVLPLDWESGPGPVRSAP
jgi:hypothetical protein